MTGSIERVACIGAGNVGRAWAIVFARAGCRVRLYDAHQSTVSAALATIGRCLDDLAQHQLITDPAAVLERIEAAPSLASAVAGAHYIQESTTEDARVKTEVFRTIMDAASTGAVIASSTSALPLSSFASELPTRERCLVAHPVNPPYLIPLVELCPAPWTSAEATARTRAFMERIGQKPIVLKREIAGFLLNRLQYTLVGEALHLLGEGYCEPEDIDAILTDGLALRWALLGPLAVAHLNATRGFAGFVEQLGAMMRTIGADANPGYAWDDALVETIHQSLERSMPISDMDRQQQNRDRAIMALLRWKQRQARRDSASAAGTAGDDR